MNHIMETSQQLEPIRKDMHKAIEDRDAARVKRYLDEEPELRCWLLPPDKESALYKAVKEKAFRIYGLLLSRKCSFKDGRESICLMHLSRIEQAEIRRQEFFATECEDSYIHYLKSKSQSLTQCDDLESKLDRMFQQMVNVDLLRNILKVAATAPYLKIRFDNESENVQLVAGRCRRGDLGLTFLEDEKVYIGGKREEAELWGTFAHEMCHLALHLVYRNNGRPYFLDDTDRRQQYKDIVDDIKQREAKIDDIIRQSFMENEEEELIVRVPHILAQRGGNGYTILDKDAPELFDFFKGAVIQDMLTYIESASPGKDSERIKEENARLQKAFKTRNLEVKFERSLSLRDLGSMPLVILTGPNFPLLKIMVHNAVRSTGQSYLFFETGQWDFTLRNVLVANKCTFVVVSENSNTDCKDVLELLSEHAHVTGTKVIFLVQDNVKEMFLKVVNEDNFFAKNHDVKNLPEACFGQVTRTCKNDVFTKSRIELQSEDACSLSDTMDIESLLGCIDITTFLKLCESECIKVGPPLHKLQDDVAKYFVERECRRALQLNLRECRIDDENEAFALLMCDGSNAAKFLPRGCSAVTKEDLKEFEKFVLLTEVSDYDSLKNVDHYKNKVVHLLQLDETRDALLWTKSNGPLSHLPMTTNVTYKCDALLTATEKLVVICGAPGMGKSALASWYCTEIKQWKRWVLYVDLPQKMTSFNTVSDAMRDLANLCEVTEDKLHFALFERSVNSGGPFEVVVIFDAFDEIDEKSRKLILDIALFLSGAKVYKIFIFTRTVFKAEVQDALHTVPYELVPFAEDEQEVFRKKYREQKNDSAQNRNVAVPHKVENMYSCLRKSENELLGTPLLLRMMVEMENEEIASSDDSTSYRGADIVDDIDDNTSRYIVDLYKMFVEYKYMWYRREKKRDQIGIAAVEDDNIDMKNVFYKKHGILAVSVIYPKGILGELLTEDKHIYLDPPGPLIKDVAENHLRQGFVSGLKDGTPVFVHKTFAEFFAADYLLRKLKYTKDERFVNEVSKLCTVETDKQNMLWFDSLASSTRRLHSAIINRDTSYFEHRVIKEKDMRVVDKLKRTALHVAALYADKEILEKLPMDDRLVTNDTLVTNDSLGLSPFAYASCLFLRDSRLSFYGTPYVAPELRKKESENYQRLNVLCARCSDEALKYFNQMLSAHDSAREKITRTVTRAVMYDLTGVLDIYLTYFVPKYKTRILETSYLEKVNARIERSSRCSVDIPENWDLDNIHARLYSRSVLSYSTSMAACKMLQPYCFVYVFDRDRNTMLHISAEEGHLEAVQFHLSHSFVDLENKDGDTPLHLAAHRGHTKIVKLLLPLYASVNLPNGDGETPMSLCVQKVGKVDTIKLLLFRTRMNSSNPVGRTPLHLASMNWDLNTMTCLLPHCSYDIRDMHGLTCLHTAAVRNTSNIVKCIIPHSAVNCPDHVGRIPVHIAARRGESKTVLSLLPYTDMSTANDGKHLLKFLTLEMFDILGKNILQFSVGRVRCVKALLLHSDVNATDDSGRTALHLIASGKSTGQQYNAVLLLPHSNVHAKDNRGRIPLRVAMKNEQREDIVLLLRRWTEIDDNDDDDIHDADMANVDVDGNTALHVSAKCGNVNLVQSHLACSSINVTNKWENTPLHLSARKGHTEVIKLLLPLYPSVNLFNLFQETPMYLSTEQGKVGTIELLLLRSRTDLANDMGFTSLHSACRRGLLDAVTFLLPHSSTNMRDGSGKTCLFHASKDGGLNVVRSLIPHSVTRCDNEGRSPVQICATLGRIEEVIALLPYSFNYDLKHLLCALPECEDSVIAHSSTDKKQLNRDGMLCMKRLLLYTGFHDDDCYGETPVTTILMKRLEEIKLVLPHLNRIENADFTLQHAVLRYPMDDYVVTLLERWADMTEMENRWIAYDSVDTKLHESARDGSLEAVKLTSRTFSDRYK